MCFQVAKRIVADTPLLQGIDAIHYLPAGYSQDQKYVLWERGSPRYLLRMTSIDLKERRVCERDFRILAKHNERGVLCPKPYQFGFDEKAQLCWSVLGYIPGQDAQEVLPKQSTGQQYALGIAAGRELYKLHQLRCPKVEEGWHSRRKAKWLRYVRTARDIGLGFDRQQEVERYIESNLDLLESSPVRFQHDDFHPANLIVDKGRFAGVVDFNRIDLGDPMEDFQKVPWFTVPVSAHFALGQIDGYFPHGVPDKFWKRYNFFVALNLHSALVWANNYSPGQLVLFQNRLSQIIETHDFIDNGPPAWHEKLRGRP